MKRIIILSLALLGGIFPASAQFTDDFQDGDFTQNPTWAGENTKFVVENGRLRLVAEAVSGSAYLATESKVTDNLSLSTSVFMGFNPSSANYVDLYLLADNPNPADIQNGLLLRIGTSDDNLSLRHIENGSSSTLLSTADDIVDVDSVALRFEVRYQDEQLELLVDTLLLGSFNLNESVIFNEILTAGYFVLHPNYTSTRSQKFWFDDIAVSGTQEQIPPRILAASTEGLTGIGISFSETLDSTSVQTQDFDIAGSSPSQLAFFGDSVFLNWSAPFSNPSTQNLNIGGLQDAVGNTMADTTLSLDFFISERAQLGDVFINEMHFDPTPIIGLPDAEYVELWNVSNKVFAMDSLVLVNSTTALEMPSGIFPPNSYLILCSANDTNLFSGLPVAGLASFPALSNGGDSLTLLSEGGIWLDGVAYEPNWISDADKREGGWSLEARNPAVNCLGASNFDASESPLGGTPGAANSLYDANFTGNPIAVSNVEVRNDSTLFIPFLTPQRNLDTSNVSASISPGITVKSLRVESEGISIQTENTLPFDVLLEITVGGIEDCVGNGLAVTEFTLLRARTPQPGDLRITEIMSDPSPVVGLPEVEYVELYNTRDYTLELNGISFLGKRLDAAYRLPAKSYLVITSEEGAALYENVVENVLGVAGLGNFFLANSGTTIRVENAAGQEIIAQSYLPAWHDLSFASEGGYSLELRDLDLACTQNAFAWASSRSDLGGTPGSANETTSYQVPEQLALVATRLKAPTLALEFNQPISVDTAAVNFSGFNTSPILTSTSDTQLRFQLQENLVAGTSYAVSVNLQRCGMLGDTTFTVRLTQPEDPAGRLVFNELLYDPAEPTGEYIELYNRSGQSVSINGLQLATETNGSTFLVDSSGYLLAPQGYVLISRDTAQLTATYPQYDAAAYVAQARMPSLSNSGSNVYLLDRAGAVLDFLAYDPSWHFGELINTQGVALERINPNAGSNVAGNWTSASTASNYGTPGRKNSQFSVAEMGEVLRVNPPFITPNNDGFDDVCSVALSGLDTEATVEVEIYNRNGHLVAVLAHRQLAQPEMEFTWNGEDSNGFRVPRGIYLIVATLENKGKKTVQKAVITVG